MRLGLSSAAAPDATLDELLVATRRRGLTSLELREGDAHGVDARLSDGTAADVAARLAAAGIEDLSWRALSTRDAQALAAISHSLRLRLLLDEAVGALWQRVELAASVRQLGGDAALVVRGSDALEQAKTLVHYEAPVSWDAEPHVTPAGALGGALLAALATRLVQISLAGGGPEVSLQEGLGVGELMARLALSGYNGALTVSPSSPRYRVVWQTWLGRRGGTGCGSKASDPSLVNLGNVQEVA